MAYFSRLKWYYFLTVSANIFHGRNLRARRVNHIGDLRPSASFCQRGVYTPQNERILFRLGRPGTLCIPTSSVDIRNLLHADIFHPVFGLFSSRRRRSLAIENMARYSPPIQTTFICPRSENDRRDKSVGLRRPR